MRVGIGHDTHRLVEGRPLILGGLRLEHPRGLAGHSDADVVAILHTELEYYRAIGAIGPELAGPVDPDAGPGPADG